MPNNVFTAAYFITVILLNLYHCAHGLPTISFFRSDYKFLEGQGYYKFHNNERNWQDAKASCESEGAALFYPETKAELDAILITDWTVFIWIHIGISDLSEEGVFKTIDGKQSRDVYMSWLGDEPINAGEEEDCVQMHLAGYMMGISCSSKNPYICRRRLETTTTHVLSGESTTITTVESTIPFFQSDYKFLKEVKTFYKFHTSQKTWKNAKKTCESEGAALFYPKTKVELDAVLENWNDFNWIHIGISDLAKEGVFETIDGKHADEVFISWMRGEPNNYIVEEDCVLMQNGGFMNDAPCRLRHPFICRKSFESDIIQSFFEKDYIFLKEAQSFYKFNTRLMNWKDAKKSCELEGATLIDKDNFKAVLEHWEDLTSSKANVFKFIFRDGLRESWIDKPFINGEESCTLQNYFGILNNYSLCRSNHPFICMKKNTNTTQPTMQLSTSSIIQPTTEISIPSFRNDYTLLEETKCFYKFHTKHMNWEDAKNSCESEGAALFYPKNQVELDAVLENWNDFYWIHIGISDLAVEGVFETIDGKRADEVFISWMRGEPNNYIVEEDCVLMQNDGFMNDAPCRLGHPFICRKSFESDIIQPSFEKDYIFLKEAQSFYKFNTRRMNWKDAKKSCESEGATLIDKDNFKAVLEHWDDLTSSKANVFKFIFRDGYRESWIDNPFINGEESCSLQNYFGILNNYSHCRSNHPFICMIKNKNTTEPTMQLSTTIQPTTQISISSFMQLSINDRRTKESMNSNNHITEPTSQCIVQPDHLVLFQSDYKFLKESQSFYKFHKNHINWKDAKESCKSEEAELFYPETETELDAVLKYWNDFNTERKWIHIGISDKSANGVFETVDGKRAQDVYISWREGQPNNVGGHEHCVGMLNTGRMDDIPCHLEFPFICRKRLDSVKLDNKCNLADQSYVYNEGTKKCYKLHFTPKSWTDAYSVCIKEQSYLAIIDSKEENQMLSVMAKLAGYIDTANEFIHLGYRHEDDRGWTTLKNLPLENSNVFGKINIREEINSNIKDETCGALNSNGELTSIECNKKYSFVCEHDVNYLPANETVQYEVTTSKKAQSENTADKIVQYEVTTENIAQYEATSDNNVYEATSDNST